MGMVAGGGGGAQGAAPAPPPAPGPGQRCLPGDGEQVAGGVHLQLHAAVLQLQQASPHVHLLLEGADQLLTKVFHRGLFALPAVLLHLGCRLNGRWERSAEEEQSGQESLGPPGLSPLFLPKRLLCNHPLQEVLLDYPPPTSHFYTVFRR